MKVEISRSGIEYLNHIEIADYENYVSGGANDPPGRRTSFNSLPSPVRLAAYAVYLNNFNDALESASFQVKRTFIIVGAMITTAYGALNYISNLEMVKNIRDGHKDKDNVYWAVNEMAHDMSNNISASKLESNLTSGYYANFTASNHSSLVN